MAEAQGVQAQFAPRNGLGVTRRFSTVWGPVLSGETSLKSIDISATFRRWNGALSKIKHVK